MDKLLVQCTAKPVIYGSLRFTTTFFKKTELHDPKNKTISVSPRFLFDEFGYNDHPLITNILLCIFLFVDTGPSVNFSQPIASTTGEKFQWPFMTGFAVQLFCIKMCARTKTEIITKINQAPTKIQSEYI